MPLPGLVDSESLRAGEQGAALLVSQSAPATSGYFSVGRQSGATWQLPRRVFQPTWASKILEIQVDLDVLTSDVLA